VHACDGVPAARRTFPRPVDEPSLVDFLLCGDEAEPCAAFRPRRSTERLSLSPVPDSMTSQRLLLVGADDSPLGDAAVALRHDGFAAHHVQGVIDAMASLRSSTVDLVVIDLPADDRKSDSVLAQIRAEFPALPILVVAAAAAEESHLLHHGASDVVRRPLSLQVLRQALARAFAAQLERQQERQVLQRFGRFLEGIVGRSRRMTEVYERIMRVAPSSAPVLVAGETGTGKELVAGAIHRVSGRGSFVPVNCSAIPAHLLESELFGHVRGAFTGADRDRRGLFEAAHQGTLFLDEIAELPLELQPKLLRVLQSGEFRRVGEVEVRRVDVRIIAATHRDLRDEVRAGRFREDLFFRINVLQVEVPPLRERPTDIPLLAERFLSRLAERDNEPRKSFTPDALAALVAYPWPGNVRQLLNFVERSAILADGREITRDALPDEILGATTRSDRIGSAADRCLTLAELEREYIFEILERCNGNKSRAAHLLGMPRRTLYRRLEEYEASG
jgi:DNA-binding NtrC family response regulator